MPPSTKHSIVDCLVDCGVESPAVFEDCESLDEEFGIIKRVYFAKILNEHPDKGGDAERFRTTRAAFEVLRELHSKGRVRRGSFASYLTAKEKQQETAEEWDEIFENFESGEVPSYEHFAEAAEEEVPGYKVELARTGRSQCVKCKGKKGKSPKAFLKADDGGVEDVVAAVSFGGGVMATMTAGGTTTLGMNIVDAPQNISKGDIRVGSLDDKSGTYGRWHHISCWRVPSRVWSGLVEPTNPETCLRDLIRMDEVLLTGLADIDEEHQRVFVRHVMNRSHWAKKYKKKATTTTAKKRAAAEEPAASGNSKRSKTEEDGKPEAASTALINTKQHFQLPRPGADGALEDHLAEKTFVLTGIFPEVGGGRGLSLGKDKVKKMIESFGGRVTSAVSGKTDYLVVGKEPGASKVGKAQSLGVPMIDLRTLQELLYGRKTFDDVDVQEPPRIKSFSAGYGAKRIAS